MARNGQALVRVPTHLEIVDHSPDGFEWGYYGSGPSQLALALLYETLLAADVFEARRLAAQFHQRMKFELLNSLTGGRSNHWSCTSDVILAWFRQAKIEAVQQEYPERGHRAARTPFGAWERRDDDGKSNK